MDIKNEMLWRIYAVLFCIVAFALLIFGKVVKTNVIEGSYWREMQDSMYVKFMPVEAERGDILADDGSLLASSLPFYEVRMDTKPEGLTDEVFQKNVDSLAFYLATYIDNSFTPGGYRQRLIEARQRGDRYLLIKKSISYTELEEIKKFPLFNLGRYKGGLIVEPRNKREHPYKMLAHRTIGYVREGIQPIGIEGAFNKDLAGDVGLRLKQRVAGGIWIPVNDLTEVKAKEGNDVKTTLDINLQDVVQEALLKALKNHDAEFGTAIVMEVSTGAIKAISNIGRHEDAWWETYNYGVGMQMEPGSTFKLANILALLEDGYIKVTDTIDLEKGRTTFYEDELVDATKHNIEKTTIRQAFAMSSNVGMAKLVNEYYGKTKRASQFIQRLRDMNLDIPTGIEIDGELPPYIKDPSKKDKWSGTTLPWMAMGYEMTLSPLQLLTFYNAVANDGRMMKPYLVSEIQQYGETIRRYKPTVVNRKIASYKSIREAKELLKEVVETGTAKLLRTDDYDFAGKTGTAQTNYQKIRNGNALRYRASFAGFFPYEKPIYSCIVVINNPKSGGYYGAEVAGPVFREIADKSFFSKMAMHQPINSKARPLLATKQLPSFDAGLKKDIEKVLKYVRVPYYEKNKTEWSMLKSEHDSLKMMPKLVKKDLVPNVVGMGLRDALFVLEKEGLRTRVNGVGKVTNQSIKPGTAAKGQEVIISLN